MRATMTLALMVTCATAWATDVQTYYIDENGTSYNVTATVLTGYETSIGTAGETTWYVVNSDITYNGKISYLGNPSLILADGKTMTVNNGDEPAIQCLNSTKLTIYGQTLGSGSLVASSASGKAAIQTRGNIEIYGGHVSATGRIGIEVQYIYIKGGSVSATGTLQGITAWSFYVYSGQVTAMGGEGYKGIQSDNNITIGWRKTSDFITWNGYSSESHTVYIMDYKTFYAGATAYYDDGNGIGVSIPDGTVTLRPYSSDDLSVNEAGTEYTIHTAAGWDVFCDLLQNNSKGYFTNKTVKLGASIGTAENPITRMAGGSYHDFTGTFNGQGNTLTFTYSATEAYAAPFRYVEGPSATVHAAIQNLNVISAVTGTNCRHLSGLIGLSGSNVDVSNCNVEVNITSNKGTDDNEMYPSGLMSQCTGPVTISGCTVTGEIATNAKYAAGILGIVQGSATIATITDCVSSVTINSSTAGDGTHGGFVAVSYPGSTTIEGCLFNGKLLTVGTTDTKNCGGFVGWRTTATVSISNSLYAPADLADGETEVQFDENEEHPTATFVRNGNANTITNCYYTRALGTAQGTKVYSITAGENVTVAFSGTPTVYTTSGITAYKNGDTQLPGLLYNNNNNDVLYAGDGDAVSLTLTNNLGEPPTGYQLNYIASNGGTITSSGNSYTLAMPNDDVIISATFSAIPWSGSGSSTDPYLIEYPSQLDLLAYRVNGTHGYTAEADGFSGTFFKLNNDIEYSYTSDWDETSSNESNYEAIGYYGGSSEDRPFKGDFDGNNKTVGGIRIYKSGTSYTDQYQGLFGQTQGANIHDLTLADARITGYKCTGGIVGYSSFYTSHHSTITNCHVAADVAIHAVQSGTKQLGGIAGYNHYNCTISQCTSAATISITGDNEWYYGGIAGYNGQGILSDNFVVGATIPTAADNRHGAICGYNSDGTLANNFYYACNVAGVANATDMGCNNADITTNDGAIPVFTLTLDDNLTTTTTATVSYNETNYFKNGLTVTVDANSVTIPEGYTFSGIAVTPTTGDAPAVTDNHDGTYSFTMPAANVTVSATLIAPEPVTYLDENGDEQTKQPSEYTILTGSETELTGGWYVVNSDISYTGTVTLSGNVNLILADGKTMNVGTSDNRISDGDGIICYDEANDTYNDLTIYGQSLGTGKLSIYVSGNYYHAIAPHNITVNGGNVITHTDGNNSCGIDTKRSGDITINGGNVSAITTDTYIFAWAISAAGNITINGGTVNAESNGQAIHAAGNIDINSGNVTATTTSADLAGIYSSHTITLGWTNATDRIYASSYRGTVNIASGQVFVTDDATPVVVSGTISDMNLINGKTLYPAVAVTLGEGITAGSGIITSGGNHYAQVGQTVTVTLDAGSITVPAGYTVSGITVTPTVEVTGSNGTYSFTMPAANVTVSANLNAIEWSGSGTSGSPYIIMYPSQLDLLAYRVNGTHGYPAETDGFSGKYFKLGADITYPHTTDWNDANSEENNYEAIGGYYDGKNRHFMGHFDGNNKTVSGIRIYKGGNTTADMYQGLFGVIWNGSIHDLTLADTRIAGYSRIGGIAGYTYNNIITHCHVTADVTIHAVTNDYYFGGIAGRNDGKITHCTSSATLTANDNECKDLGAIVGFNYYGTLEDNLAIGATIPENNGHSYGTICGLHNNGSFARNYYYNCTVAGVENATGVGCGYISDGNGGYAPSDITTNDGAVPGNARTVAGYGTSEEVGWTFIASPLTENTDPDSEAVVDIISASEYDLYRLNPSSEMWENWKEGTNNVAPGFSLENGRGYLYATQQQETVKFVGEANAFNLSDTKEVTLPQGFNLVGNPFPRAAYINKPYYTLNAEGSAVLTETSTGYISPCMGVVVEVENGNDPVIFRTTPFPQQNANNNGNLNIALTQVVEPVETPARDGNGPSTLRQAQGPALLDNAIVSFNEGSQLGKFYFGTQNANIYLPQGGKDYAIVSVGNMGEVPVNFRANENGTYTLTISETLNSQLSTLNYLHLIDNMTGADVDLLQTPEYTFNAKVTDYESRFKLVFVCGDANDDNDGDNETFAFYFNGSWIIANEGEATLQVIDLNGRILSSETVNGSVSKSIHAAPGVYMIRLINGDNVKVQKVIIE